jgi:hypothetical protein
MLETYRSVIGRRSDDDDTTGEDRDARAARVTGAVRYLKDQHYASTLMRSRAVPIATLRSRTDTDLLQHAWDLFGGALRTTVSGGDQWNNLQIVAGPSVVQWDDPQFGPYYFHKDSADLINEIGSTYRKSDRSFSERYGDFLNDVLRPPINQSALEASRTALTNATADEARHSDLVDNIQLEWQAFDDRQRSSLPPYQWIGVEDWYDSRGKNRIIAASREIVLANWADYFHDIQEAFGSGETLAGMVDRFHNAQLIDVLAPRTDAARAAGKVSVYPYQVSPDYPSWLAQAKAGAHQPVRFTINHATYSYDYSASSIGAGVGLFFGFFGVLGSGSRQTVMIDTTSTSFQLDFEADVQTFSITPGVWYSSSAFSLFGGGPFYPNSPMDNLRSKGALFGPRGFLSFRPARAIVAYKPKITVRVSQHEYHYFKQVTQGAAGFFVGPFAIGVGSYYDVRESVRWDDQNLTLSLFNAPDTPHLLAFDSQDLP